MGESITDIVDFVTNNPPGEDFHPNIFYEPSGDQILFFLKPDHFEAVRLNGDITVLVHPETNDLVGVQLKGVKSRIFGRKPAVVDAVIKRNKEPVLKLLFIVGLARSLSSEPVENPGREMIRTLLEESPEEDAFAMLSV